MQKHNLKALVEYDDERFSPKVLMNEPGYRMVLLSMREGQRIPEYATQGMATVQAILGHVTIYAGSFPNELYAGEIVCIASGIPHLIEAIEDSALLVVSTSGADSATRDSEELDLCKFPRSQRHSLVFAKFDALAVGDSFVLVNDHNPVLLNRELENSRPGQAAWERLDRGPERYHIRIRRVAPSQSTGNLAVTRPEELVHEIHKV